MKRYWIKVEHKKKTFYVNHITALPTKQIVLVCGDKNDEIGWQFEDLIEDDVPDTSFYVDTPNSDGESIKVDLQHNVHYGAKHILIELDDYNV